MHAARESFDREFALGDEEVFDRLVTGFVGQKCIAWRKSYGNTGGLHFGQFIAKRAPPRKAVHRDQGSWVLWIGACDQRLTLSTGELHESKGEENGTVLARMQALVGEAARHIGIDAITLSLTVEFSDGSKLELVPDAMCGSDDEQWDLTLPGGNTVVAWTGRRWALQDE